MVRTRLPGSAELNEVREAIGLRPTARADEWTIPGQAVSGAPVVSPDVMRRGGYPADRLSRRMRRLVGAITIVSGGVALIHQVLAGVLAHGWGPWGTVATLLAWPAPLIQPILAGVGALVLSAVGMVTWGWRDIRPRQDWLLLAGVIAAVLGAGPMVLMFVLTAVVCVLAAIVALVILFYFLALLMR